MGTSATESGPEVNRPYDQVSVVIPTFNRGEKLAEILHPVLDDPLTGEVVVVVDGSRDGSFEMLQEWSLADPRLRPIFQENAGDAAARQRGIEAASFDVVVVLDDDVVVSAGTIGGHARHHADGKRLLVLGYMPTRVPNHGVRAKLRLFSTQTNTRSNARNMRRILSRSSVASGWGTYR